MKIVRSKWTIVTKDRTKIWCIAKGTQCFFNDITDDRGIIRTYNSKENAQKANLDFYDKIGLKYEFVKIKETIEIPD